MTQDNVRVGVGVFVVKDGTFVVMRRTGSHGYNTWCLPGGHLENGESWEDAARREVHEETGLRITNVRFAAVTNDIFAESGKHYVTIWIISDWADGEPVIAEPHKFDRQEWRTLDDLPSPLFESWHRLFESDFMNVVRLALRP